MICRCGTEFSGRIRGGALEPCIGGLHGFCFFLRVSFRSWVRVQFWENVTPR
jgi:hypothetical protein